MFYISNVGYFLNMNMHIINFFYETVLFLIPQLI